MIEFKFKDICEVINGRAYKQNELLNEGKYKVLRVGNFFSSDKWYYSNLELDTDKYCDNNDLLFAWSASFGPKIWDGNKVIYHYHIWKLLPKENVDKFYLYYWLLNSTNKILAGTHGSVMAHITKNDMENQLIKLPALKIQKQIANIMHSLDKKIKINNLINNNLEQQAQAIFKSWFVDFEPFGGTIPDGWITGHLSDLADIKSGKRPNKKSTDKTIEMNIPIVGAASIMGYTNEYLYNEKILVTGRVGTHGVIQKFCTPCWTSDNTLVILTKYYEFIYQVLKTVDFQNMNRGSTQPLITQTDLKNIEIIIPGNDILENFEEKIDSLMKLQNNLLAENEQLSALRDTLLPKLMSGEIDVDKVEV